MKTSEEMTVNCPNCGCKLKIKAIISNIFEETKDNLTQEFKISATFDYVGDPEYYQGHDQGYEHDDVLACYMFRIPVDYSETIDEIITKVLDDLDNKTRFLSKDIRDLFPQALRNEIEGECQGNERFFTAEPLDKRHELPTLIGFIHVYPVS